MVLAVAGMWPGVLEQGGLECERAWWSLVMEKEIPVWAEHRLVGVCWEHRLGLAGRSPGCVSSTQAGGLVCRRLCHIQELDLKSRVNLTS